LQKEKNNYTIERRVNSEKKKVTPKLGAYIIIIEASHNSIHL
jgi:hypothetical protein